MRFASLDEGEVGAEQRDCNKESIADEGHARERLGRRKAAAILDVQMKQIRASKDGKETQKQERYTGEPNADAPAD